MNIQLKMIYNSDAEDYNPIYLIAAALDPNTIGILSDIDLNTAAEWICKMLPSEQLMQEVPSVLSHESPSVLDSILHKMTDERKQNQGNHSQSTLRKKSWVLQCLHRIQNISDPVSLYRITDPVKYWNANLSTEWHAIASFALDILSISGSGAPIEAVFSQAEIATTSRRNKTGSELLNAQLIISCNRDILGQIFYYY